jgi:general secretion pathway protein F
MATFRYSAYKKDGREVTGHLEAETARDARDRLNRDGLFPREIVAADLTATGSIKALFRTVGLAELALMTRRLATLLGASVPVYEAVATLFEQEQPGELKNILSRIRERLAEGSSLAKSLAAEPKVFSESYVSMVAAGEASGALDIVLERLAEFMESQDAVRSKIVTSLAYPVLMLVVGTGVMIFLLAFVIPKIVVVFENNKAALPLITILLIKTSTMIRKGWWAIAGLAAALLFAWRKLKQKESVIILQDRYLLRIPVIGLVIRDLILSRFAKVLGLLLMSGVPVIRALEITGEVVVNREYRMFIRSAKEEIIQGNSLSMSLRNNALFPPLLVHMIGVGEKSGQLEQMLVKTGAAFEKEFDSSISRFMALLEPMLVLGMGLGVGLVVIAVLLPIFQLNELVK